MYLITGVHLVSLKNFCSICAQEAFYVHHLVSITCQIYVWNMELVKYMDGIWNRSNIWMEYKIGQIYAWNME